MNKTKGPAAALDDYASWLLVERTLLKARLRAMRAEVRSVANALESSVIQRIADEDFETTLQVLPTGAIPRDPEQIDELAEAIEEAAMGEGGANGDLASGATELDSKALQALHERVVAAGDEVRAFAERLGAFAEVCREWATPVRADFDDAEDYKAELEEWEAASAEREKRTRKDLAEAKREAEKERVR